jgi:hypothetical protein
VAGTVLLVSLASRSAILVAGVLAVAGFVIYAVRNVGWREETWSTGLR